MSRSLFFGFIRRLEEDTHFDTETVLQHIEFRLTLTNLVAILNNINSIAPNHYKNYFDENGDKIGERETKYRPAKTRVDWSIAYWAPAPIFMEARRLLYSLFVATQASALPSLTYTFWA